MRRRIFLLTLAGLPLAGCGVAVSAGAVPSAGASGVPLAQAGAAASTRSGHRHTRAGAAEGYPTVCGAHGLPLTRRRATLCLRGGLRKHDPCR